MKHNQLSSSSSQNKQILSIDQLLEKIKQITFDFNSYYEHTKQGTLQLYYQQIISEVAKDITLLTLMIKLMQNDVNDFSINDIDIDVDVDADENTKEVAEHFLEIIEMLAIFFAKNKITVYKDLVTAIALCPAEDLKISLLLKKKNKLH